MDDSLTTVSGELHCKNLSKLKGLKIIFILGCLEVGGAEQQAMLLARWLKMECCANVEVWGVSHGGRLTSSCEDLGVSWRIIGNPLTDNFITTMWRFLKVALSLRKAKANILLPYTLVPNTICGMLWRFSGVRLCIWNQRDEGIEGHREPFESWAIRLTPLFVANSNSSADFVIQNLHVDKYKVLVVPNGVALAPPVASRSDWRQRLGLTDSAICIGMIANISDKKDHSTLLKAWSEVVANLSPAPGQLLLVLAGSYNGNAKGLIDLVSTLNLSEYVTFLGPVMDVSGLLEAFDIGAYSSVSEGLPNGVLECMAMGKAIVATRIPGICAALGDGYALLSQPGVPAEMAAHLITLINNPEMRKSIGQQNRERAAACFDRESMCKKMVKIIEDNLERYYV